MGVQHARLAFSNTCALDDENPNHWILRVWHNPAFRTDIAPTVHLPPSQVDDVPLAGRTRRATTSISIGAAFTMRPSPSSTPYPLAGGSQPNPPGARTMIAACTQTPTPEPYCTVRQASLMLEAGSLSIESAHAQFQAFIAGGVPDAFEALNACTEGRNLRAYQRHIYRTGVFPLPPELEALGYTLAGTLVMELKAFAWLFRSDVTGEDIWFVTSLCDQATRSNVFSLRPAATSPSGGTRHPISGSTAFASRMPSPRRQEAACPPARLVRPRCSSATRTTRTSCGTNCLRCYCAKPRLPFLVSPSN